METKSVVNDEHSHKNDERTQIEFCTLGMFIIGRYLSWSTRRDANTSRSLQILIDLRKLQNYL